MEKKECQATAISFQQSSVKILNQKKVIFFPIKIKQNSFRSLNFFLKGESEAQILSTTDTKSSQAVSKAEAAADAREKTQQSKNAAINNMILVLMIATIFFNLSYWIIFVNINNRSDQLKSNDINSLVISREIECILILLKFSITGLLFFISGEIFRKNLYIFIRKCYRCSFFKE